MRTLAIAFVLLLPLAANAGRRPYLVGYDTTNVPDGDVEIESWGDYLWNRSGWNSGWRWWIGPVWAVTETLELSAFTSLEQDVTGPATPSSAQLWAELLTARWRAWTHRYGRLTLQLDGRIAVANDLPHQVSPKIGWASHIGRFGFTAQVGYAAGFAGPSSASDYHWITWNAGAVVDVVKGEIAPPFQIGVEAFGEGVIVGKNDLSGQAGSTVNVGPTIAVAKGRLWLSAGALFGVTNTSPVVFFRGVVGLAL